ncbi:MAG: Ig-like domain-containing protein [Gemmatimonadales bacterium]|nr:Ig-like domain-containing protein [Gemmatimonadales bacterium]
MSAIIVTLACGGDDLVLPSEGEPASIEIVRGNEQFGRVGEPLAEPLVARVLDSGERPVVDVPVALALGDDRLAESVPDTASTDVDGMAGFRIVLGSQIGTLSGQARVVIAGGERILEVPVRFTAVSAEAAGLTLVAGDGQSAPVGSPLPEPLVVQVADVFGNPIAGVPIAWTAEGGGSTSASVVETDADGRSSVERVLGVTAGAQFTRASADSLAGSPVTFQHTATAGAAAGLSLVSGDGQSAVVGTPVPDLLVVRLLDAQGNPVVGVPVAWVVGAGSGTVAPQTTSTDGAGLASTQWTLGPAPGANTLTAVVSGIGVVPFGATALPGTPPGMRLLTQPAESGRRGVVLGRQPVVQLLNPGGIELRQAGVSVTVTAASGGGRVRGTLTRTTDGDGRATFTDLALEGPPGGYTLAFSAAGFTGVLSGPISLARATTATTIESDTPDPSAPGASVRVVFSVRSDGGQVPGDVLVRADDGASCQATVSSGACSLAPTRTGAQQLTASYQGTAEFEPSSAVEDHLVEAPLTPVLAFLTAPSSSAVSGVPFETQPVVQLRDGAGADLATAGVQVTVAVVSGGGSLIGATSRATDAAGRATFEGLGIQGATRDHTIRFTAQGFTPVTSGAIQVSAVPTATSIVSDAPDPSAPGQGVDVRFSVTAAAGAPAGDVTVSAGPGESCTASVAAGGCAITLVQPGTRTLTARYAGVGAFGSSEDTESHTVQAPAPTGPSPSASRVSVEPGSITAITGRSIIRAEVRDAGGNALGGVSVQVAASGSGNLISPISPVTDGSGVARFELSSSVAETKTVSAVAAGVVLADQPTIVVSLASTETRVVSDDPDPSEAGALVTVGVSVSSGAGQPPGEVTVTGGGGSCTASAAGGSCQLALSEPGEVTLTARYAGNASFAPSEDAERHQVRAPAQRVLRLVTEPSNRAAVGVPFDRQPVVQLALEGQGDVEQSGVTVSARPASGAGPLQGQITAVTDGNGRAAFADLAIAGEGTHTLEFTAEGYQSVVSRTIDVVRLETNIQITSHTPEPSPPGGQVTVSFTVTSDAGTPPGRVTVTAAGGSESCSAEAGAGSCPIILNGAGDRDLTATYEGSSQFAPSSDTESHEVESPNAPPSAADDAYETSEGSDRTLDVAAPGVLANDQDAESDGLRAELVGGPANGTVALDADGGFRYTPAADFFGADGFTYRAADGGGFSAPATVRITVRPVNDPPSFTRGPDQIASVGAGGQTVPGWATEIFAGPNETGQSLAFVVQVLSGGEIFASAPAISPDGTLSYTPGAPGTAQVEVRLQDDGGTGDGGSDTSGPVTISFVFTP